MTGLWRLFDTCNSKVSHISPNDIFLGFSLRNYDKLSQYGFVVNTGCQKHTCQASYLSSTANHSSPNTYPLIRLSPRFGRRPPRYLSWVWITVTEANSKWRNVKYNHRFSTLGVEKSQPDVSMLHNLGSFFPSFHKRDSAGYLMVLEAADEMAHKATLYRISSCLTRSRSYFLSSYNTLDREIMMGD